MSKNSRKILKIGDLVKKSLRELERPSNFKPIIDDAVIIVRRRTLLGFGVTENGKPREKLKTLSESYVSQRQGKLGFFTDSFGRVRKLVNPKKKLKLSDKTTPRKSNLTLTGQLLASLKSFITGPGKGEVRPTGQRRQDRLTNLEVSEFVSEDRPYLNLSNNEIKQLEIKITNSLIQIINKKLLKLK